MIEEEGRERKRRETEAANERESEKEGELGGEIIRYGRADEVAGERRVSLRGCIWRERLASSDRLGLIGTRGF